MAKFIEYALTCFPPFIQHAAAYALNYMDKITAEFRNDLRKKRDYALGRLKEIGSFVPNNVEGGFYLFPTYYQKIPSRELAMRLLEEKNVAVLPGSAFGTRGEWKVRITFSGSLESFEKGMDRIEDFIKKLS